MPKTLKSLKTMEVSCVTMVKGHQHMEVVAGTCKSARERKAGAYALQQQLKRDFHSTLCNGMVCFNAHHGHTHEAEKWMKYLDTKQGDVAQVETLNALLAALIKKGDLVKADEWFKRVQHAALHPELSSLRPQRSTYDVMIQGMANANDLPRAEHYLLDVLRLNERAHSRSFSDVIEALLRAGEPRRAHLWMQDLVQNGCCTWPSYSPELVRQRSRELRHRRGNVEEHLELVHRLVKELAAVENTVTANEWLLYLVQCGQRPDQSPETWDAVRAKAPLQILPARLYCEEPNNQPTRSSQANSQGALQMWRDRAPLQLPALLSGETEEDRHRYLQNNSEPETAMQMGEVVQSTGAKEKLEKPPICHSQASTRAETVSRPGTSLEVLDSRPGTALSSQGLQKCLQMKKRREKMAQANEARRLCWEAAQEHQRQAKPETTS